MPILNVRSLPQKDPSLIPKAMKATCEAISHVYDCDPKHVWITWETIEPGFYLEGNLAEDSQPLATHPPLCQLTCFEGKSPEEIELVLQAAAKTLSESLEIPNNIFITYHEAKSGRVVDGNGIVRK